MHGFSRLSDSRVWILSTLLLLVLGPLPAAGQTKSTPPQQPPSTAKSGGTSRGPVAIEAGHVRLGDEAPNFKLLDRQGQETSFHLWRGSRAAVLLFGDRSTDFGSGFSNLVANLEKLDVRTVGICRSSGAIPASLPTEEGGAVILRDRWGDLAGQFGAVEQLSGDAVPAVVILDPHGRVRYLAAGVMPNLAIVEGIVNGVLERAKEETF